MIKAVVFDLDNTLYDQTEFVLPAFKRVSKLVSEKYGKNEKAVNRELADLWKDIGPERPRIFDLIAKKFGLRGDAVNLMVKEYRSSRPELSLYRGALPVMEKLKRTYKLGLITDGNIESQKYKLSALGISGLFNVIVFSGAEGSAEKPSTRPYAEIAGKLGIRTEEMVYVGDNPYRDFIGAKALGIRTIRVLTGPLKEVRVSNEQDAERTIKNLGKLIDTIGNM